VTGLATGTDGAERAPKRRLAVFVGGVALAVGVGLAAFSLLLRPATNDLAAMTAYLTLTAAISVAAGYAAYRLGWMKRSPRLVWTLMAGYLLAQALMFVNVLVTARLMFLNRHDLLLSTVLLVFASVIAVSLGYLFSSNVADAVRKVNHAAGEVARGELDVVVVEEGPDEIAELARSFNQMTARLREAARQRSEFERGRRDLITAVGHDLRTPLASVKVIVEALTDGVVDDPTTVNRYLLTAQHDLATLSELVDDLFTLAQLDSEGLQLECRANSLRDLLSDALESFTPQAEAQSVRLRGEYRVERDGAVFDAKYIGRALANLVDNALRHTSSGGEVVLCTDRTDDGIVVQVSDTGEGIAAEDLPYVFDRFYRADQSRSRATGGGGMGLAIVKGIIEAHGGRVAVESWPQRGSTFSFTLPG
jgi:signal transduction histidine kinase